LNGILDELEPGSETSLVAVGSIHGQGELLLEYIESLGAAR
jgi:hypothetical protein